MKLVLAPLAGFTDAPFRRMCFEGGADLCYTEMVSAAGLAHGSSPTRELMETMAGEGPVAVQLFGAKEDELAFSVREIERTCRDRFCEINLNAGCPMTKVTREGAGAKLVEDPEKIYRLVAAMVRETSLPVTLKTRLGPHPQRTNALEIADAAERAGAKGLVFHARYTSQMHGGEVHLDVLADIVRQAHVPVTGNGSVTNRATLAAMAKTGVSAVMIGRAALAHPDVFAFLKGDDRAQTDGPALARKHLGYLLRFREQLAERFPDNHIPGADGFVSVKTHIHLFRYFGGRPGAAALRARLALVRTRDEIEEILAAS